MQILLAAARIGAKVDTLHIILEAKGLTLSDEQYDLLVSSEDEAELSRWIIRAATATSTDAVFED